MKYNNFEMAISPASSGEAYYSYVMSLPVLTKEEEKELAQDLLDNNNLDSAKKLTDSTKIFSLLANFGDSKSLIIHPSSTTHQQLDEEQQMSTGVTSDLVRLSIGLEDPVDLIEDLQNAIKSL